MLFALLLQVSWSEDASLKRGVALAVDNRARVLVLDDRGALRRFEDVDGDGRAEPSSLLAEGLDASGLMVMGEDVWAPGVPALWVLKDGKPETRKALFKGFGAQPGEGPGSPVQGPDGKVYFASGAGGFRVLTQEGDRLEYPDMGAVLRCDADGANLEVFAIGLRELRDLSFDQNGELFGWEREGAAARWIHIPEGADLGWRRGLPAAEAAGAHVLPAVARLESPLPPVAYCPARNLFVTAGGTCFAPAARGAGFELAPAPRFEGGGTDAEVGPDGALYVLDAAAGTLRRTPAVEAPEETRTLLREGMKERAPEALAALLGHANLRVRRAAQQELVGRQGSTKILTDTAKGGPNRMARIHAIWGLGQLYTRNQLFPLLKDKDEEIRVQTARVLGDRRVGDAYDGLAQALKDESPRVRRYAATALGKIGRKEGAKPLAALLRENDDRDPVLRHAAMHALALIGGGSMLQELAKDGSRAVRLAALVAARRLARPEVDLLLDDPELAVEAARAIHDLPIQAVLPRLAAKLGKPELPEAAQPRALNANYRLGLAEPLAAFAAKEGVAEALRIEALRALAAWAKPAPEDRVTGARRPLSERDPAPAREALGKVLDVLRKDPSAAVRAEAEKAAGALR